MKRLNNVFIGRGGNFAGTCVADTDVFLRNLIHALVTKPPGTSDEDIITEFWSDAAYFKRDEVWAVRW